MYEQYSKQALPSKSYRELLGAAVCVFNSNNAFLIENILRFDIGGEYSWHKLMDQTSGTLGDQIIDTIEKVTNLDIAGKFTELVDRRNRIMHSFQVTDADGGQILYTKTKAKDGNEQFPITEDYLKSFIQLNEEFSMALHSIRGDHP